ncbi:Ran-binding protein 10 [Harpegnathos saltator]|uniref:Ran-binding protein 10 n=1 Tax=Harpegnathos saltator TaxID=610380 RepID=E2BQ23_HARSA|nr:Ran-binding protein 10 [Harpegnathos saltator]
MAATSDERSVMEPTRTTSGPGQPIDRLKLLYPMVNEEETPLPRSWSPKDKFNYIGLSQNNLRVHYKDRPRAMSCFVTNEIEEFLEKINLKIYWPVFQYKY